MRQRGVLEAHDPLLASFQSNVKASVFITSFSFGIYVLARLTGPLLRDYRRRQQQSESARQQAEPSGTPVRTGEP